MRKKFLTILGIETSCDETAVSLLQITNQYKYTNIKILSNVVSSQVKIHAKYGGIVPEVAARKHAENIISVLMAALNPKSQIPNPKQIPNPPPLRGEARPTKLGGKFKKLIDKIDAIAVTIGPGLITSLLVGVEAAKTLAFLAKKPLVPVNHLAAHIYANFIGNWKLEIGNLFPAICLVVSGGHTELILMKDFEKFKKIGQTLDDAAGECFDKVAKILELGYPGGPAIANITNQHKLSTNITNKNNSRKFVNKFVKISDIQLPRPMINTPDFNFSFSGLKTAVLYKVKSYRLRVKSYIPEFCHEVQQAIIDVLIEKTLRAAKKFKAKSIILGGGVTANNELRKQFESKVYSLLSKVKFFAPAKNLCTDNAAMIAAGGYFQLLTTNKKDWLEKFDWRKIKVDPNLEI